MLVLTVILIHEASTETEMFLPHPQRRLALPVFPSDLLMCFASCSC